MKGYWNRKWLTVNLFELTVLKIWLMALLLEKVLPFLIEQTEQISKTQYFFFTPKIEP
jgi:hypothetical protein